MTIQSQDGYGTRVASFLTDFLAAAEQHPELVALAQRAQQLQAEAPESAPAMLEKLLTLFHITDANALQWSFESGTTVGDVTSPEFENKLIQVRGTEDYLV